MRDASSLLFEHVGLLEGARTAKASPASISLQTSTSTRTVYGQLSMEMGRANVPRLHLRQASSWRKSLQCRQRGKCCGTAAHERTRIQGQCHKTRMTLTCASIAQAPPPCTGRGQTPPRLRPTAPSGLTGSGPPRSSPPHVALLTTCSRWRAPLGLHQCTLQARGTGRGQQRPQSACRDASPRART